MKKSKKITTKQKEEIKKISEDKEKSKIDKTLILNNDKDKQANLISK